MRKWRQQMYQDLRNFGSWHMCTVLWFVQALSSVRLFGVPWTCSTPGFPAHHHLLELAHTHVGWVGDAIQTSHPLLSPSPPAFNLPPASGYFPMSQFSASGGQSIWASASASVPPMNIQDWFPLALTRLISLQSKGLSRGFSNNRVQKHQFFSTQLSL